MSREIPARIHRYEVLSEIGGGAMGQVYLAMDPHIGRRLALKILRPERLGRPDRLEEIHERFLREARAAGQLDHPGIVTVFDADSDPASGEPYLAMEYVEGQSLRALLEDKKVLPIPQALGIAIQVARALHFAHQRQVIHRDIKPANLLIRTDGLVKVADFGIAKLVSPALTQPGRLLGTPYYMAPEQLRGTGADGRSDLFALGIVLYECLDGDVPFSGDDVGSVQYRILQEPPPEITASQIPPALWVVLRKALSKAPEERFNNGEAFAVALETVLRSLPAGPSYSTVGAITTHSGVISHSGAISHSGVISPGLPLPGETPTEPMPPLPHVPPQANQDPNATRFVPPGVNPAPPDQAQVPNPRQVLGPETHATVLTGRGAVDGRWQRSLPAALAVLLVLAAVAFWMRPSGTPPVAGHPGAEGTDSGSHGTVNDSTATDAGNLLIDDTPIDDTLIDDTGVEGPADGSVPGDGVDTANVNPPPVARTPPPPPPRAPPPEPVADATLEIVLQYRLRRGQVTVWIDGRALISTELNTSVVRNIGRGKETRWTLTVPAGKRTVDVHLSSRRESREFEARNTETVVFSPNETKTLSLTQPQKSGDRLSFEWLEP